MKKIVKSGLAVLSLAILAACGGGGGDTPAAAPPSPDAPVGAAPPVETAPPVVAPPPVVVPPVVAPPPVVVPPVVAPPPPIAGTSLSLAQAVAGRQDALLRTSIPTTAAAALSIDDGCYLSNGNTKAMLSAEIDANITEYVAENAYRIGSTRTNMRVTAERNITNADGSTRREADVLYDINFTDGSKDVDVVNMVVTGSTAGLCATPQNSVEGRFLGNQRVVSVFVNARNDRNEQYSRTSGQLLPNAARYTNALQFGVSDPQGKAAYAIVTGPGSFNINGVATPFSVKLLSTRLLRDDLSLAGKNNNFSNWKARDTFRFCRTPASLVGNANSPIPANVTDCTLGANNNLIGRDLNVTSAGANTALISALDQSFAAFGFVVGGTYTFKIYNDDGWKTVNGEAGKTPIATYTAVNDTLPYTFAQMVGTNGFGDHKFAKLVSSSLDPVQTAAALDSSAPSPLSITWSAPAAQADGRVFRFTEVGEFFQGAKTSNAVGAFFPAERYYKPTYLTGNSTAANALAITPTPSSIQNKSYAEFGLYYTDRNRGRIFNFISFQ